VDATTLRLATALQTAVGNLPDWAPLLIAPIGASGLLVYWYLFLRDE
jgi:CBS-domain-containing membrane protein